MGGIKITRPIMEKSRLAREDENGLRRNRTKRREDKTKTVRKHNYHSPNTDKSSSRFNLRAQRAGLARAMVGMEVRGQLTEAVESLEGRQS